jgi:hypothetical protein
VRTTGSEEPVPDLFYRPIVALGVERIKQLPEDLPISGLESLHLRPHFAAIPADLASRAHSTVSWYLATMLSRFWNSFRNAP